MRIIKFIVTASIGYFWSIMSINPASCQASDNSMNINTNFNLTFHVKSEDVRSLEVRNEQSAFYSLSHPNGDVKAHDEIQKKSPAESSTVQITSSPGGMLYKTEEGADKFFFAYNEVADESYIYQSKSNLFWVNKGLRSQEIPFIPLPGVGLYKFHLFNPTNSTAVLNGLIEGNGTLDTGEQVPASAIYDASSGVPKCTKCTYYFTGTRLPRSEWTFEDFVYYSGHWIAKTSICLTYLGYSPLSGKPTLHPVLSAPLQRTEYTLESFSTSQVKNHDLDSMLRLINGNTAVEFFDGNKGVVSFQYNPVYGSLDMQKRRALALKGALTADAASHANRSIISGVVLLVGLAISMTWILVKRRFHGS